MPPPWSQPFERLGLITRRDEGARLGYVTDAGRQLAAGAPATLQILTFLAHHVDNLRARAALIVASHTLMDEFRLAIASGVSVEYARQIIPDAFVAAVDETLAAG